jgi:carbonic anhydrase
MTRPKLLPSYLVQRYHGWRATTFVENETWYHHLATEGQSPRAMVISCCDSRVHVTSVFGADQGEFFIHRNIANLVPPYQPDGGQHGTSAAIEYAVNVLKVAHLIVIGHSSCGGVQGCIDMCNGNAPELDKKESFVGRWMDLLRPTYAEVAEIENPKEQAEALEKKAILVSLENLMTFPYVASLVSSGKLSLHGVWMDLAHGGLQHFDDERDAFVKI